MAIIDTSIFELFKIGPGPSSSHTIGPMRAGLDFIHAINDLAPERIGQADQIEVRLFGSLSATGKGHGTDRAVLAGLLGQDPETCPSEFLDGLLSGADQVYPVTVGDRTVTIHPRDIRFDRVNHDFPFNNTLIIDLSGPKGLIFQREYYSVGGGFLQWKGWTPAPKGRPLFPYGTMKELREALTREKISLPDLILANEEAITGKPRADILDGLDTILAAMESAVRTGIKAEGLLPGPLGVMRKAPVLFARARDEEADRGADVLLKDLNAFSFAASEENAAGHRIVTAPTAGSAGVMPAVTFAARHRLQRTGDEVRQGLLAAAAIGFLAKQNASIAGAEVGCQGEIGVAAAMAAGFLAQCAGRSPDIVEHAAEIALEHHLGLTCDPVGGYVQIPCIERNAMGAVKAYNAWLIASTETPGHHKVALDTVIQAMAATGRDMSDKYKETGLGGLAVCLVSC